MRNYLLLFLFVVIAGTIRGQSKDTTLYTTYTFTIIYNTPLDQKNVDEIEGLIKPLPSVYYCRLNPKTKVLVVQVRDEKNFPKLVSSEIKQMVQDIGQYDVGHEFSMQQKKSLLLFPEKDE